MIINLRSIALALVTVSVAPFCLTAQRADSTAKKDSLAAARVQQLPRVVVTGELGPSIAKPGGAGEVIGRDAMRAEPTRAAVDVLRYANGVHVDESDGTLESTIIRLRGSEEQFSQILIDGVSLNEQGGYFTWGGFALVNVDAVEIALGPQSAVYGTSAMAGAVQIRTRAGTAGPIRSELTLEGGGASGNGNSRRATFETQGGSDLLRFSAGLGAAYDRGIYTVPNNMHTRDASLRLDLAPSSTFSISGTARSIFHETGLPVRDAGATRAPLDPNQKEDGDRTVGSLEAAWTPSARWTHHLTVSDYHMVSTFDDLRDSLNAALYSFFIRDYTIHATNVLDRTTARYVGTVTATPDESIGGALSYGAEWQKEWLTSSSSGDFGPSSQTMSRPNTAVFSEGQLRVGDQWSFLAGARAQRFEGVGSTLVPRATAVFALIPNHVALRAAAASAYNAPNIQVQFTDPAFLQGNPDLKPETSTSYEVGVDLTGEQASLSATVFSQTYDNLIRVVPFNATKQIARNIGRTTASGLELKGAIRPMAQWMVGAEGAWTGTNVVDNSGLATDIFPNGEPMPFRPAYTASVFTRLAAAGGESVTLRLSGVGRQTVLAGKFRGPRVTNAPYNTVGATGVYPVHSTLDVFVHAENVLNANYAIAYDKIGSPRSIEIGVRARLSESMK